jgi:hypothetical protein
MCAHVSESRAHDYSHSEIGRTDHDSVVTVSVETARLVRELEGAVDLLATLGVARAEPAGSRRYPPNPDDLS